MLLVLLASSSAVADPAAPPLQRKPACHSNLYIEPSWLGGVSSEGRWVGRMHGALGFRYSHCPADGPEGFRVHAGGFLQVGSKAIGGYVNAGFEAELNAPLRFGRLGGRAYVGLAERDLYMIGGGARYRVHPGFVGVEVIYSSGRSESNDKPAVGVFGVIGASGHPVFVVAGILGVLGAGALLSFETS